MARGPNLDTFISAADRALRSLLAPPAAGRPVPPTPTSTGSKGDTALSTDEKRESAALMRVNHAGEVAAQALYHAQAMFARDPRKCGSSCSMPPVKKPITWPGARPV